MINNNAKNKSESYQRVTTFLSRKEVDLLDKIGKDALFTKGTKLSRTKIISCLIDLLSELELNGEGISSIEELRQKIKQRIGLTWPTTKELMTINDKEKDKERFYKHVVL